MIFKDRNEAGIKLSEKIFGKKIDVIVSLPRGGVVVGSQISSKLKIPHSAIVIKKITHPAQPELALGAVGSENQIYWDQDLLCDLKLPQKEIDFSLKLAKIKQKKYEKMFGKLKDVSGKVVALVDDGVATGSTSILGSKILKKKGVKKILLLVPVISVDTKEKISSYFDSIIALNVTSSLKSVGQFYEDFTQVRDEDVVKLLVSVKSG